MSSWSFDLDEEFLSTRIILMRELMVLQLLHHRTIEPPVEEFNCHRHIVALSLPALLLQYWLLQARYSHVLPSSLHITTKHVDVLEISIMLCWSARWSSTSWSGACNINDHARGTDIWDDHRVATHQATLTATSKSDKCHNVGYVHQHGETRSRQLKARSRNEYMW